MRSATLGWLLLFTAMGCDDGRDRACPAPAASAGVDLGAELPVHVTGSTVGADDHVTDATCGSLEDGPDALFTWSAPYAGRFHFSTEGSDFDTVLFVREGSPDGAELECNDDYRDSGLFSSFALELEACQTVVIAVDGFGGATGEFALSIEGEEVTCDDGLDDDGDGAIDCDDSDCFGPACSRADDWPRDWTDLEWAMLEEVNRYRRMGAQCDGEPFAPAPPFEMDETIRRASRLHSQDMGAQNYFDHTSPDGGTFDQRMSSAGFMGPAPWGENIAAGYATAMAATEGLMNSPGHCRNIMNPQFRVIGIGYAYDPTSELGHYWTQNFAAGH